MNLLYILFLLFFEWFLTFLFIIFLIIESFFYLVLYPCSKKSNAGLRDGMTGHLFQEVLKEKE